MKWNKIEDGPPPDGVTVAVTDGKRAGIGEWIPARMARHVFPLWNGDIWKLRQEDTMLPGGWKVWWPHLARLDSEEDFEPEPTHWAVIELPDEGRAA